MWRLQEFGCFLMCWTCAVLLYRGLQPGAEPYAPFPVLRGVLPLGFLLQAYLTGTFVVLLNSIRTLGAHRFLNDGREMTFIDQLIDSVNYPRQPFLSELWAPVGLRFHALHHLFPAMPYHNLAKAHHRLMAQLPADSPYRLTVAHSLPSALAALLEVSRKSSRQPAPSRG